MAGEEKQKIQNLIGEIRQQVKTADAELENALQQRENILAIPITRAEVKSNLAQAVDASAARFEESLHSIVKGRARRRNAVGVNRAPDVTRQQANYSQLNVDAINFFFGDIIKAKTESFIDSVDYFGLEDGIDDKEQATRLADIDSDIDQKQAARDAIAEDLKTILK